jgi:serine/threonine protein kinase
VSLDRVARVFEDHSFRERYDVLDRIGSGPLSPTSAVHLMCQMLDALACADARGIVHRDVKPENILVTETGRGATP